MGYLELLILVRGNARAQMRDKRGVEHPRLSVYMINSRIWDAIGIKTTMLMSAKKKKYLIPEETFKSDFAPLTGFYDYHIKKKQILVSLDEVQNMGVTLKPMKRKEIADVDSKDLAVNTICFSSIKRKRYVKNLFWTLRCLVAHPENIRIKTVNGKKCYSIYCTTKDNDKLVPTMKGIISCEIWPRFTEQIINKIKEKEK